MKGAEGQACSDRGEGAGVDVNVRKENAEIGGSCAGLDGAVYCSQLYSNRSTAVTLPDVDPKPRPRVGDSALGEDEERSSIVG